ncbi:MAG: hypothetical protein Fur0037_25840 [Planctomycetota bacterium]
MTHRLRMPRRRALAGSFLPVAFAAACGGSDPCASPDPPPLALRPRVPELALIAKAAPAPCDPKAARQLVELLDALGGDARLASRAERDLREHEQAAQFLAFALSDPDPTRRSRAAWLLGGIGDPSSVVPLLLRAKDETRPRVRLWIADALSRLGNDSMLLDIVQAMDSAATANDAGRSAIELLRAAGVEVPESPTYAYLKDRLRELHRAWRLEGVARRASSPAPALDPRVKGQMAALLLGVEDFNLRRTDEARFVLAGSGVLALPLLRIALGAEERDLRDLGIQTAIALGPVSAPLVGYLLPLLRDPLLAPQAVRALGETRSVEAIPFVRARLCAPDLEIRCAAAAALGFLGDEASAPRLEALRADETLPMDLRVQAAFGLALLEQRHPARAFLRGLSERHEFHEPTIRRMLERIAEFEDR